METISSRGDLGLVGDLPCYLFPDSELYIGGLWALVLGDMWYGNVWWMAQTVIIQRWPRRSDKVGLCRYRMSFLHQLDGVPIAKIGTASFTASFARLIRTITRSHQSRLILPAYRRHPRSTQDEGYLGSIWQRQQDSLLISLHILHLQTRRSLQVNQTQSLSRRETQILPWDAWRFSKMVP